MQEIINRIKSLNPKPKSYLPAILFVLTTGLVLLLLPNKMVFKYEYSKGSPWKYEDLISDFNFPVYKSELQLRNEKDSIRNNSISYYTFSDAIGEHAVNLFHEDFSRIVDLKAYEVEDTTMLEVFADKFSSELKAIYSQGIIRAGLAAEEQNILYLFKNGSANQVHTNDFLKHREAFLHIHRRLDSLKREYEIVIPNLPVERYIDPNIEYDEFNTRRMLSRELAEVSPVQGMVKQGERIISKGEPVDTDKFAILESLKTEYYQSKGKDSYDYMVSLGHLSLLSILFLSLYFYLRLNEPQILKNIRHSMYVLFMPLVFIVITSVFVRFVPLDIYLIPFAILPVMTVNFHNVRLAIFHHTVLILIVSLFVTGSAEFIFTQFVVGFAAAIGVSQLQNRQQILRTVGIILIVFILSYLSFSLLREGNFSKISIARIALISVSGIFVLISYPLIYLFERIFGYLSNISLLEMSDLNHPLLKKLSQDAPGTFQHSLQVANIAESVAAEIGANPLLARTGALYHDIGKMKDPQFFIENQLHGVNPHDKIKPLQSAEIIRNHIISGVATAKKYNLPEIIIEFIKTHHGTGKIQYFLHAEKQANPEQKPDESKFSYPGPRPRSKEATIVMFTDSVEAASRSLKEVSEEAIGGLVEQIVEKHVQAGQIQEADITFAEIAQIKKVLKEKIKNIYHTRIEYPKDETEN